MAKFGHKIPAVLIPDNDICVQVSIPNHSDYIALFLRAVRMLETQRMYERDEDLSAKVVAAQWRDRTVTPLIEAIAQGFSCGDELADCISYPAYAGFVHYFPDNPYVEGEDVPEGFLLPAWWRWGKLETSLPDFIDDYFELLLEQFTGYKPNDALTWIGSIPVSLSWSDFLDIGGIFPRIEVKVTGKGQANLSFISFPLGGRVIVEVDEMPNIIDILDGGFLDPNSSAIDTDRDLVSFPPEENVLNVFPVEIEEEGDHTIYCVFLPLINDSIIPIGFGGGLRGVELCGGLRPQGMPEPPPPPPLEGVTELKPEFQFTVDCGLEYRLRDQEDNIVQDWTPVAGWDENAGLCFGGGNVATKDDIRDGMYEAINRVAAQIVTGQYTGFTVDDDGNVVVGGDEGGVDLPDDDPETEFDESEAARFGGTIEVTHAWEKLLDLVDTYYGPVNNTPVTDAADTLVRIMAFFPVDDPAISLAIDNYYTWRTTENRIIWDNNNTFLRYIYCHGNNQRALNQYLIEVSGFASEKLNLVLSFAAACGDSFFSTYIADGSQRPSTAYLEAPCVPTKDQSMTGIQFATNVIGTPLKGSHRLQFHVEGYFVDPDGDLQDAFWYRTNAGVLTRKHPDILQQGNIIDPTDQQVIYNSAHVYDYTVDSPDLGGFYSVQFFKDGGMAAGSTSPTGGFTVNLHDLGQATNI